MEITSACATKRAACRNNRAKKDHAYSEYNTHHKYVAIRVKPNCGSLFTKMSRETTAYASGWTSAVTARRVGDRCRNG